MKSAQSAASREQLPRRPAAVDEHRTAGHERRGVRREEHGHARHLVELAPASERDLADELLVGDRVVQQLPVHLGGEGPGADRVAGHAGAGPFEREHLGQADDARFRRGVGGAARDRNHRQDRPDVDDAAPAARDHLRADRPRSTGTGP